VAAAALDAIQLFVQRLRLGAVFSWRHLLECRFQVA
jgi:hypothetical protein